MFDKVIVRDFILTATETANCVMRFLPVIVTLLCAATSLCCPMSVAHAAILGTGNLDPANPSTWTDSTIGYIAKDDYSTGTVTVNGGSGLRSYDGYVGHGSHSTGTATISGTVSKWTNSHKLYVGRYGGSGTLNIEASGQVSNSWGYVGYGASSAGMVTVTGAGSKWKGNDYLYVGCYGGSGTLNIQAGGQVESTSVNVGYGGSTGTAKVAGAGSRWTTFDISIGWSHGSGTVNIEDGGQLINAGTAYLGATSGFISKATVTGTGSKWTNDDKLYIGYDGGSAMLTVANGGFVSAKTLYASPSDLFGNGTIAAEGAVLDADLTFDVFQGSQATLAFGKGGTLNVNADGTGELGAGYTSAGTLTIANGATAASSYGCLGYDHGSTGTATVTGAGSKWISRGNNPGNGNLHIGICGNGTLNVEAGGLVSNNNGFLGAYSYTTGTVTVTGADSTWNNTGNLTVGYSQGIGILNIANSGLVRVAGTMSIDDDEDGDSFVNMLTGGKLALSGDADDSLTDFLGLVEGTDAIRWWDASLGHWSLLTTATEGIDYRLEYTDDGDLAGYTLLTVGVVPEPNSIAMLVGVALAALLRVHTASMRRAKNR
jgi:T5SS/PEP-CTERM-associated repeat protein